MFRHVPSRRSYTWLKLLTIVVFGTVFVNEYLVYWLQTYRWPTLSVIDRSKFNKYQVILLVADPQLLGYQDERMFPVGTLSRWDSDRYVSTMFSYAYQYSQPDLVVYLGDLMDEGSKATPMEYVQTLERIQSVFKPAQYVKNIYIPGDNDIGGEGRDFRTHRKMNRYEKHFGNITDMVKFGFIDYVKLDLHAENLSEDKVTAAEKLKHKQTSPMTVLLNHETLMNSPKHFIYPVTKRLRPKVIFSAHWHKSRLYTCDNCLKENEYSWSVQRNELTFIDSYLNIDLSPPDFMAEILVPTCSYRMGVADMGYGVAIIGADQSLRYTVLWLPRRYTMLLGYVMVLSICMLLYCVNYCCGRRR